jgi:hypothetical protein
MKTTPVQRLVISFATIAAIWLMVLPWIGSRESVRDRIEFLDDRGIDASAMYYTELDAMKPILEKFRRR